MTVRHVSSGLCQGWCQENSRRQHYCQQKCWLYGDID
ncbi:hypothetical protein STAFG_3069 [Streptomyces afghaniensis 772]|uniref:Uncharacterized protein n=1 Tax=Streptomyces afghaniensis 772 TaxID=1283301 RepID=S4MK00_9ACTN|nr:hypothetical protein STAFG_3069 [Streptomyces afghaniensis 772]